MSEATIEAMESEAWESGEAYEGEAAGEAGYEGEAASEAGFEALGEDARSDARWRARQRQIMLARRRQAQLRRPSSRAPVITTLSPAVRAVRSDVRTLDLQTKVALDSLRGRLNEANRLAYRNAWAAEASVAASQVLDSFENGLEPHDWARAIIRSAPTLILAPGKRQPGLQGVLLDPRVAGGALITAIWAFGHFRNESKGVSRVTVKLAGKLSVHGGHATTALLRARALDKAGNDVPDITFRYEPDNPNLFEVNETKPGVATVTAQNAGDTWLTVTAQGKNANDKYAIVPITVEA